MKRTNERTNLTTTTHTYCCIKMHIKKVIWRDGALKEHNILAINFLQIYTIYIFIINVIMFLL